MTPEAMEDLFRRWGWEFGEQRPTERDDPTYGTPTHSHPLVRAMQFPGVVEAGKRAGAAYRKITGAPAWSTDPIRCKETRSFKISLPDDTPREIQLVQTAWLGLWDYEELDARVFQAQYCWRAMTRAEKSAVLGLHVKRYDVRLPLAVRYIAGEVRARL